MTSTEELVEDDELDLPVASIELLFVLSDSESRVMVLPRERLEIVELNMVELPGPSSTVPKPSLGLSVAEASAAVASAYDGGGDLLAGDLDLWLSGVPRCGIVISVTLASSTIVRIDLRATPGSDSPRAWERNSS